MSLEWHLSAGHWLAIKNINPAVNNNVNYNFKNWISVCNFKLTK